MKKKFNISCHEKQGLVLLQKEAVDVFEYGGRFFAIFKETNYWNCTHIETGICVAIGTTKARAKSKAIDTIYENEQKFDNSIKLHLQKHGAANNLMDIIEQ